MFQHRGIWFADGEQHITTTMDREIQQKGAPLFDGAGTYQFRKWQKAYEKIKNFRHAVDIGAHVGLWSRYLVRNFSTVTAFEPIPQHRECYWLNINAADIGRVSLIPFALGDQRGEVIFSVKNTNSGITHVVPEGAPVPVGAVPAQIETLDSFGLDVVDFIKIDVEGFELNVLQGGEKTIRGFKPTIFLEQKPGNAERYGTEQLAAVKLLEAWGAIHQFEVGGDHCVRWK